MSEEVPLPGELTGFQRDILRVLARNGTIIGREIQDNLNEEYEENISHGRLYAHLSDLTSRGLILREDLNGRAIEHSLSKTGVAFIHQITAEYAKAKQELPIRVSLRNGETREDTAHARRNLAQLRKAESEL